MATASPSNKPPGFGDSFGRYVVIHASWLSPERRVHFERELARVGVRNVQVTDPVRISSENAHPAYQGRAGELSLLLTFKQLLDDAAADCVDSLVVFEDDIVFRRDFDRLWAEIASEAIARPWDVLVLHRSGERVVVENRSRPVELIEIKQNINAHCVIIRRSGYAAMSKALGYCLDKGYPADFFYGVVTHDGATRVLALTKNLTGQSAGLRSSLQKGRIRPRMFFGEFDCYRSRTEAVVYGMARGAVSLARKVIGSVRSR